MFIDSIIDIVCVQNILYAENFNKNIIENEIFKIEHQDHLFVYF